MRILGIDYGEKKIGVSFATSFIAEPYGVLKVRSTNEVILSIKKIVEKEEVEKIVVGVSEGQSAKDAVAFGKQLNKKITIPVEFQDETLSTKEAQALSIEAGVRKKKRKVLEDAYAATIILQEHIDSKQ